jgi:hypothetical protein
MKKTTMVCAVAALAASGVLTTALSAEAQQACSSYTNPVYIAGSSASEPIWAALAPALSALSTPISIIYQKPSSCVGLSEVTTAVADTTNAYYMDGSAAGVACTDPAAVQIGVSDVFPSSCANFTLPSGFQNFNGPVQVMVMAVPYASTQTSISADAAYTVFGWGGTQYPVATWTNYESIFIRTPTSGTETMIGSAIGLAASKWLSQVPDGGVSQQETSSGNVLKALQAAGAGANPSEAIGIIAADLGDADRGAAGTNDAGGITNGLKILAFQAATQTCGYLPDSDSTHFEKINVRQGRYDIWGPIHLVTAVDNNGNPTNPQAQTIIDYITAASTLTSAQVETVIQADASAHVIPQCAMQVSRSSEVTPATGGGEASYQAPVGCGCYYESLKNGGSPYSKYCQTCTGNADAGGSGACPTAYPACNFGYCEVQ